MENTEESKGLGSGGGVCAALAEAAQATSTVKDKSYPEEGDSGRDGGC